MERGKAWRPKNDENLWNGCDKFVFGKCEVWLNDKETGRVAV